MTALVGAALLLSACGGDDDTAADDASPTDGDVAAETTPPDDDGDATDSGEFADLVGRGFGSAARVTYEITSPEEATQTMVLSSDGEQTAWLMPNARMIQRADGTQIFCNESGQQAQCFQVEGQPPTDAMTATPFFGVATAFREGVEEMPGYSHTGQRDIAGRSATCATFNPAGLLAGPAAGEATLCADTDTGVMLSYEATDPEAGTASLTAVEFGEPQASDFEAPAEPVPMEQMREQVEQLEDLEQLEGMGQGG